MALQSQEDATQAASPLAYNRYAKLRCKALIRLILGQPPRNQSTATAPHRCGAGGPGYWPASAEAGDVATSSLISSSSSRASQRCSWK